MKKRTWVLIDPGLHKTLARGERTCVIVKSLCSKLLVVAWVIAFIIVSNPAAFAGTVNVKGSDAGTFLTANFSYDGKGAAIEGDSSGSDNIGGHFKSKKLNEATFGTGSCTGPDGTTGIPATLVHADEVDTYNQGQLLLDGTVGTYCVIFSTHSILATFTLSVVAGTGKFANASGSITETFDCLGLAHGQAAPNYSGDFGSCQVTRTGSVTY